jgi:excisionase family DNA binding protein
MLRVTRNRKSLTELDSTTDTKQEQPIAPLSVRISTAVKMIGIGRSKIYELIQEGEIEIVKIGSATLIPVTSLERLLERKRI